MAGQQARTIELSEGIAAELGRACSAGLLAHAEYVWSDREQAREWMSKAHPELGGRTPRDVAKTEPGARLVGDLLDKLFFGLPA